MFSKKEDMEIKNGNQIYAGSITRKKMGEIIRKREELSKDENHYYPVCHSLAFLPY